MPLNQESAEGRVMSTLGRVAFSPQGLTAMAFILGAAYYEATTHGMSELFSKTYTMVADGNGRLHMAMFDTDSPDPDHDPDKEQKFKTIECRTCHGTGTSPISGRRCLSCGGAGVEYVPE